MQNFLPDSGFVLQKYWKIEMLNELHSAAVATDKTSLRGAGNLRLAIIVSPSQMVGFLANTVATIAAGIGAAHPGIGNAKLTDQEEMTILNSADRPIPVLQADPVQMVDILDRAQTKWPELTLVVFPEFARKLHSFEAYEAEFTQRSLRQEPLSGIGLCGPAKAVKSLTGSLKLLR
nr:DUF2000 family protein [uncultured Celeribacter sp.]